MKTIAILTESTSKTAKHKVQIPMSFGFVFCSSQSRDSGAAGPPLAGENFLGQLQMAWFCHQRPTDFRESGVRATQGLSSQKGLPALAGHSASTAGDHALRPRRLPNRSRDVFSKKKQGFSGFQKTCPQGKPVKKPRY